MLVIRREQIFACAEAQTNRFAQELVAHLQTFAPIQCESMGQEALLRTVHMGLKNAQSYGFTQRGPTRLYVELMFMFGSAFDTDPQYYAVTQPLKAMEDTAEIDRAEQLYTAAMHYVDHVSGPQHAYERCALAKAAQLPYKQVIALAGQPVSHLIGLLQQLYPEKCGYIGDAAVTALANAGTAMAVHRGPAWRVGSAFFAGLMFTFGHGCFVDLQYPWVAGTLAHAASDDAAAVLERLFQKWVLYLNRAKTNLTGR